ncbi:MAG: sigma-54-dependent Fis family transcriptional regulator [Myxococcales bacterium]|nr:sigma-54-dependent Fis family transcriptional regulator [Myxococcales bacterium]
MDEYRSKQPEGSAFRALVIDDEELYARAIGRDLARAGISCDVAFNARSAIERARGGEYGFILVDHRLPDDDGIRLVPVLRAAQPNACVMVMTAYDAIPDAVRAIRAGAADYVVKEQSLQPIVERALEARRRDEVVRTAAGWRDHKSQGLLGESRAVAHVVEQLRQVASSPETTVLLTGETGVGKEVAARTLHALSRPTTSPFIAVDCVALPSTLAESLLFGHERGSFTGADQMRVGAFEEARDGTLFLDEIGDITELQAKLLRVLETRRFCRVGSVREIPLEARVVCATNQDLAARVQAGSFRLDLYQRLSVFPIHIPPLRERGEDILFLAEHFRAFFAQKLGKTIAPLGAEVREALSAYSYPGNVRELKNVLERAVILADGGEIAVTHLPQRVVHAVVTSASDIAVSFVPGIDSLESLEKRMIKEALRQANYVKADAARLLGISRFQLLRRMEKHGLRPEDEAK